MSANRRPAALVGAAAVLAAAGIVALTASMLSSLRHAFARRQGHERHDDERDRAQHALEEMTETLDPDVWGEWLRPLPQDFDFEAFRRRMPVFDPPLSQTIIDERESSR
ncbi:MAG: hypothetical protein KGK07_10440 [Chloroflexota bacterium]|nr:hypothetical protein [Chloroflexota bacterium]